MEFSEEFIKRFWDNVNVGSKDECWMWQGKPDNHGYGAIKYKQKQYRAHRASYMIHNNDFGISPDIKICHKCDTRLCVNPVHLFKGTQKDNILDMERKGRSRHPKCEKNGRAKLFPNDIIDIRNKYYNGGISQKELGLQYGMHQTEISRIVTGKNWGNDGKIKKNDKRKAFNNKLNEEKIREIQSMLKENNEGKFIAKKFNVSGSTISAIKLKKIWKDITCNEKI